MRINAKKKDEFWFKDVVKNCYKHKFFDYDILNEIVFIKNDFLFFECIFSI